MLPENLEKSKNLKLSLLRSNQFGKDHRTPNGGEKFHGGYKGKSPRVKFKKASSSEDNTSLKSMNITNESVLDQYPSSLEPFQS